jgi:hypothetical protein
LLHQRADLQQPKSCRAAGLQQAMIEDKAMAKIVAIRVQLPDTLRAKFKAQCALEEKTMSEKVIELIEQCLAEP